MSNVHEGSTVVSRRRVLQAGALAGFGAFLAACTTDINPGSSGGEQSVNVPTPPPESPNPSPAGTPASPTPKPTPTGPLEFANWPAYIDLSGKSYNSGVYKPGSSPTLEQFKRQYKIEVHYVEAIEDNKTFYAKIQPQLQGGAPTGWDLIVITDWLAAKVISKGWAEKLDQSNVPNAQTNLVDSLRNQPWDPGNDFHYPWQSGMTGIGFNTNTLKSAGITPPKSLKELWAIDPSKMSFLSEARDTFGLGLLKLGKPADPAQTTVDDIQAVHDDIRPLVDKGLRFAGNEYLKDFAAKKTWAAMVWSGDLASSGTEGDTFQVPDEGVMIWTDNLVIPKGAKNKYTAELMINFVYDPKIAAQIEDYVYYVCPVKGADAEIKKLDKSAATNPLIFPTGEMQAKYHNWQFLSDEVEAALDDAYLDLTGS